MSDVIQIAMKIFGVFEEAYYFVNFFYKMDTAYPEMCSVNFPLQETIGLYGVHISRPSATSLIYSVIIRALFK